MRQVQRYGLPVAVHGCYWGEAEGARLRAAGSSIPGYGQTGGREPTDEDQILALWSMLYTDPWYELRLLRHMPVTGSAMFGQEPPAMRLRQFVQDFTPSAGLADILNEQGLSDHFREALAAVRRSPELDQAAATAPADSLEHRQAIARAIMAFSLNAAEASGQPAINGAARDVVLERLISEFHGYGMGVGEFLLRPVKGFAQNMVTRRLTRDRGSITDTAAPTAGDILRFLADGKGARAFITQAINDLRPGPTYLVAHSLGGIMCVDLLARTPVEGVAGLVTIGSQSPFLYEIGALPGLLHPQPLPDHFPPWLNIYDRRDLLSYLGAGVFGNRVTDLSVDNGQPFPQSHSAYWGNPAVWAAIGESLR